MIRDEWSVSPSVPLVPVANGYSSNDEVDVAYDLASDPANLYIGFAIQGSAQSDAVWTIKRIALSSGSPVSTQWTAKGVAVWNNRGSETYL